MFSGLIKTSLLAALFLNGLSRADLSGEPLVTSSEATKNSKSSQYSLPPSPPGQYPPSSGSSCSVCPLTRPPQHPSQGYPQQHPGQSYEQHPGQSHEQHGIPRRCLGPVCEGVRVPPENATPLNFPPANIICLLDGVVSKPYLTEDGGALLAWTNTCPQQECSQEQYLALYELQPPAASQSASKGAEEAEDLVYGQDFPVQFDTFTVRNARIVSGKATIRGVTVAALVEPTTSVPPYNPAKESTFYVWANRDRTDRCCEEDVEPEYRVYTLPYVVREYKLSDTLLAVSTLDGKLFVFTLTTASRAPIQITATLQDQLYDVGPANYLVYVDCNYALGQAGSIITYPNSSSTCYEKGGLSTLHAVTFQAPAPGESPLTRHAFVNINAELYSRAQEVWAIRGAKTAANPYASAVAAFQELALQFQPAPKNPQGDTVLSTNAVGLLQLKSSRNESDWHRDEDKDEKVKLFALLNQTFVQALYFKSKEEYCPSAYSTSLYFLRSSFADWNEQDWFVVKDLPSSIGDGGENDEESGKFDYIRVWEALRNYRSLNPVTIFTLGKLFRRPSSSYQQQQYGNNQGQHYKGGPYSLFTYSRVGVPDVLHQ